MEKETLDWIFLKGPIIYIFSYAFLAWIFNWKRFFEEKKDELGNRKVIFVGQSRIVDIAFKIQHAAMLSAFVAGLVYYIFFRHTLGE